MKQVLLKEGKAAVQEVPAPEVVPGAVLVRVDHSCISAGTEVSGLKAAGEPLWQRALRQPQKVKKALRMVAEQGIVATHDFVKNKAAATRATGYSVAGVVIAVGEGVDDMEVGNRVACAGAQCAFHAEIVRVPRNLTVRIPQDLCFADACSVTLGAIALQGVRRANPTLGEHFVVIGLGIIGQLVAQILKANGCHVIGTDPEPNRRDLARELGADCVLEANAHAYVESNVEQVARLTGGHGADGVIVTAATSSDEVMSTAFRMCRKKGRVVLVGDVGLKLKRGDFYANELDFFISTSYGPGRYDGNYEEEGLDYPISYVRWTENRNMAAYLELLDKGKVKVGPLVGRTFHIEDAGAAYDSLAKALFPPMALISYPPATEGEVLVRKVANPRAPAARLPGLVGLAVVGAGGFAKGTHLPNLRALKNLFSLEAVVSSSGHNATATADSFGARYAATDYDEVLADDAVNAVLICTPHDSHAKMTLAALKAGKHVLVEKPLVLAPGELTGIKEFYGSLDEAAPAPLLLTGFNRRFSPFATRLKALVADRSAPMMLNYRMNAGYLPTDHWVHGPKGGGRNIGEACHIYDLFIYLTGEKCLDVQAMTIAPTGGHYSGRDNFVATLRFADGSVATLTYTALGSAEHPKETMDVYLDGKVLTLANYQSLSLAGTKAAGLGAQAVDKGHRAELRAFGEAIKSGGPWPIPLWQQIEATRISFEVEKLL